MEYEVINQNGVIRPQKIRMVASWLIDFGIRAGTIPDPSEKEADFIGKEKA